MRGLIQLCILALFLSKRVRPQLLLLQPRKGQLSSLTSSLCRSIQGGGWHPTQDHLLTSAPGVLQLVKLKKPPGTRPHIVTRATAGQMCTIGYTSNGLDTGAIRKTEQELWKTKPQVSRASFFLSLTWSLWPSSFPILTKCESPCFTP